MEREDEDLMFIGAELRKMRHAKGYKLADVSRDTAISTSFLSDVETGKTWPSLGTLIFLARHYKVPPWRILAILPD